MFTLESLVTFVVYVLVAGCVFGLLWYLVNYVCTEFGLPAPFCKIARVVLVVAGVLVCISLLLSLAGHPSVRW
jgi:hypothetical protein